MDVEKKTKQSEILQLILLDQFYARSGAEKTVFQGGTALRWVHNGARFSEDLDFVTEKNEEELEPLLDKTFAKSRLACIAHFGPGRHEAKKKGRRFGAAQVFFIFRPESQRERIAVKLEFERMEEGKLPRCEYRVLRDLPSVAGLISSGQLLFASSSSVIAVETLEELLSDKIRALYERKYLKGRDIFDVWWITRNLGEIPDISSVKRKLEMYATPFIPARRADFFVSAEGRREMFDALMADMPRFLPPEMFRVYREERFAPCIDSLQDAVRYLLRQGLEDLLSRFE